MAGAKLTGTIKSFAPSNGYGFIFCPDVADLFGTPDVFLHVKELEAAGVEMIGRGDTVEFTLAEEKGKPQAKEVSVTSSGGAGTPIGKSGGKFGGKSDGKSWGKGGGGGGGDGMFWPSMDWSNPKASQKGGGKSMGASTRPGGDKLTKAMREVVGDTASVLAGQFAKDGSPIVQLSLKALNVCLKAAGVETIENADIPEEKEVLHGHDGNKVAGPWFTGTLKQYFPEKAYGFVESAAFKEQFGDKECFIHADHIDPDGNGDLRVKVGEEVHFPLVEDEDGNAWAWAPIIPKSKSFIGYVKNWKNDYQGFGRLSCETLFSVFGEDVYCHGQPAEFGGCSITIGSPIVFNLHVSKEGKPQASSPRPPGVDVNDLPGKGGSKGGAKGGAKGGKYGDDSWGGKGMGWGGKCGDDSWGGKGMDWGGKGMNWGGKGNQWGWKGDDGAPPAKRPRVDAGLSTGHQPVDDTMYIGCVKNFNPEKGYGFITCADTHGMYGRDVFLHRNIMAQAGVEVGAAVAFQVSLNAEGHPQACSMIAQE